MRLFIGYATREGQSRRIARHVAERAMDAGHSVLLMPVADAEPEDLTGAERVVLTAPIHASHYPKELSEFVSGARTRLADLPSLFMSVSLAAAGHDAEEWRAIERIGADFEEATGWSPDRVEQVAGAYRPSEYDLFTRFMMRRIIADKDPDRDLGEDHEYTDWTALDRLIDDWLAA